MGLFSRKESASTSRHASRPRPSVSSEAQAASMRVRARRRLAGAVAVVLAAVIVLPMLLDGAPKPIPASVEVSVPKRDTPFQPNLEPTQVADAGAGHVAGSVSTTESAGTTAGSAVAPNGGVSAATTTGTATGAAATATDQATVSTKPEHVAEVKQPEIKPEPKSSTQNQRTDDGAKALALLEGRAPMPGSATTSNGSGFVVQVASYSSQSDAQARRDKLRSEGVTNAFVESTTVNGKSTFRLRVGPFGARDAAQAAQTRLRSLGYPNGFIATQ